jgi:1-acyl-sn-glycerol-3-phosphate acyltransferase
MGSLTDVTTRAHGRVVPLRVARSAPKDPWHALLASALDEGAFDPARLDLRDAALVAALLPRFETLATRYFRLEVEGIEHLREQPALYVANHNGGILGPDLVCTLATLWRSLGTDVPLYAMAHDFAMRRVVALGRMLQRVGALRADPRNAREALAAGGSVLVYPGGDLDAYRPFWHRDRIVFGARTGFVRVAQEMRVPIVPIVAHGAHRSAIIVHEGEWLASALGLTRWSRIRRFPVALALPWGVGVGPWVPYFPLPFRIRLRALPPVYPKPGDAPETLRDAVVRAMQRAMDEMARRP